MGGRQVRTGKQFGQIFDHHFVEYTYADGTKMFSQCRQIPGCWNSVSEHVGQHRLDPHRPSRASTSGSNAGQAASGERRRGKSPKGPAVNPYQVEHDTLFDAIRNNRPYNEVAYAATSTMTAILGRMATYSGKLVKWDEALNSQLSLRPERIAWDAKPRDLPDKNGGYPVAMPGTTRAF